MSCDVGKAREGLENELWRRWSEGKVGEWAELIDIEIQQSSFSNLSVTSPTSQLILQPFRHFIYVTAHSPTLPLLYLRHSSFSNPSFASPTSQILYLIHLASRPWKEPLWWASIPGIYRIPRCTGHQYVIWQTYREGFLLLSTMSHRRCLITHGLRLKHGWTFPMPLMEAMLWFMQHKVEESQFSLFVVICFI